MTFKRNIIAIYSAYLINGILSISVVPLALCRMGVDGYGLYAIYGVLAQCCLLLGMGLNKHFMRLLSSHREADFQIANLRVAWAFRLIVSIVLLVCLPAISLIVPKFLFPVDSSSVHLVHWLVALAVVEYVLAAPTELMTFYCIANERIDRYSTFVVASGLYRYALMFLGVIVFEAPLPTVALLVARRLIDPWVAHHIMGKYPREAWRPRLDFAEFAACFRGATMLSLVEVGHVIMVSLGSVLANTYCGLSGLGFYRAAFDLTSRLYMISNGLAQVTFPRFAHLLAAKEQSKTILVRIPGILDASWAGYLVFCAIVAWAASSVLPLVGLQTEVVQLFMLLLLGTGMNAHGMLGYQFLQAAGKYIMATLAVGIGILALVASCDVLHAHFGILALGWSWIVSQLIYAIIVDIEACWLAEGSLVRLTQHVAFRLLVALAATTIGARLIVPTSVSAFVLSLVCLVAIVFAIYGLRTVAEITRPSTGNNTA